MTRALCRIGNRRGGEHRREKNGRAGTNMQIQVSKDSDVPLRQQIVEQIVFQITTEKLKPGQPLSSVRELARRLKIHHNTVSEAYQELVRRRWLVRQGPGSRLLVRPAEISDA